jgi:hypothetical protein
MVYYLPIRLAGRERARPDHPNRASDRSIYGARSKPVASIRIILHGKAAGDARVRTAVHALRRDGHSVEVRVTREPGDAARLTAETVGELQQPKSIPSSPVAATAQSTRYSQRRMRLACLEAVVSAFFPWAPPTILLTRQAFRLRI